MERERSIERMNLDWCDRIMEDMGVCWRNVRNFCCRGGGVVDGVVVVVEESMKSDNGVEIIDDVEKRLHPSVLVDTSVEASSFFDASSLNQEEQQQEVDDNDAIHGKVVGEETAPMVNC
jgi:hypothetical protein